MNLVFIQLSKLIVYGLDLLVVEKRTVGKNEFSTELTTTFGVDKYENRALRWSTWHRHSLGFRRENVRWNVKFLEKI